MAKNGREPVTLKGEEIRVWPGADNSLWPTLRAWLGRQADAHINARVAAYAPQLGVKVRPVEMREWRRRWGECHPDGHLRFNWRLIMLPPEIIDYVVVHELAHLLAPGHNPRFWGVVAAILPDYQARRQLAQPLRHAVSAVAAVKRVFRPRGPRRRRLLLPVMVLQGPYPA